MMALCPNEIKTHQIVVFQIALEVRKHRRNISAISISFSAIEKSLENHSKPLEVAGRFSEIPLMTRQKSPAFETKKVGRYTTFLLMKNMDPSERR